MEQSVIHASELVGESIALESEMDNFGEEDSVE